MEDLATTSSQTQQHGGTYANADADQLMQRLLAEAGAQLLNAPRIETSPGVEANIFIGNEVEHFKLSAMPTLTPGAGGIDLKLGVQIRAPQQSR